MDYEIVIPVLISFAISAILGPIVIPFLKRLKVGQTERKELESHLKKNGTPTMGGLMILASIIITSLFYVKDYPRIIPILFMTVGFGVIGFLDDYLKVVLQIRRTAPVAEDDLTVYCDNSICSLHGALFRN